jgi:hypothetical protein
LLGGDIVVLNIYASTDVRIRIDLWGEFLAVLPRDYWWLMVGDWNMVEYRSDKSSGCGRIMTDAECLIFQQLKVVLKVEDKFPTPSPINFFGIINGGMVLGYLPDWIEFTRASLSQLRLSRWMEYYIRGDNDHSDYLPVRRKFLLQAKARRKSSYAMNACYLGKERVKARINRIWSSHPNLGFTGKLRKVVKCYKEY